MNSVCAVIPSLNGGTRLAELAGELVGSGAQVRVADNGMPAEIAAGVARAGATVVAMNGNVGFGRAVNAAAADAPGGALVVLNDDLEPCPGLLEALVAALDGAAMASGILLKAEAREIVETAGVVVDRHLGVYDHLQDLPLAALHADAPAPLGPTGGAAAFRRAAFDRVGGFDPGFFAYFEDVDLAIRLRLAGERCALAAAARAVHVGSATLGYDSVAKAMLVGAGRGRLVRKYGLLRSPGSAAWVLATEAAATLELTRRHRSLGPARARVSGFRACRERSPRPPVAAATVGLRDGLARRYGRSRRVTLR